ncbi:IclR family transcriptional regulator domain-containing protein [Ochrobactrum vermis]|uniref:IclR family transcriptional regulator domain-containing protein n=1 Tax=Ochrobactrum vermis TaxID=1827297 RepID=UPI0033075FC0
MRSAGGFKNGSGEKPLKDNTAIQSRILNGQLEALTPFTIVKLAILAKEFIEVRRQGWATAPNETAVGLNTLASPIFDASGMVCGATGIVDMIQAVGEVPSEAQVACTIETAHKISLGLGYRGH